MYIYEDILYLQHIIYIKVNSNNFKKLRYCSYICPGEGKMLFCQSVNFKQE